MKGARELSTDNYIISAKNKLVWKIDNLTGEKEIIYEQK